MFRHVSIPKFSIGLESMTEKRVISLKKSVFVGTLAFNKNLFHKQLELCSQILMFAWSSICLINTER